MKKFLPPAVVLSVSILALSLLARSAAHADKPAKTTTANETYMVIKITDDNKADKKVEYRAIATSRYKDEEKKVKDDYAQKLKEHKDLIKTDPSTPRPKKILIKKVKTGYLTQKIAQEYADKLRDEESDKDGGVVKPKDIKK